jgi:hypothetical protein
MPSRPELFCSLADQKAQEPGAVRALPPVQHSAALSVNFVYEG